MHFAIPCLLWQSSLPLKTMKISVLGVGTELTNGQILNHNGQWISESIMKLGVPTSMHLVVPDEKELILQALQFCWNHSDLLFVTGGLGPTSDDFTREVIALWLDRKLVWHEASWKHIEGRLIPRGIAVNEIQKQQCYFPENAKVLINRMGTANAFQVDHEGKTVYVLPGPPREIEAIWQDHLQSQFKEKMANVDALITLSWDTLGLGESDVADKVEAALAGCPFMKKGYRVHHPFVEVKLSFLKSEELIAQKWIQAVEQAIGPITVLRNAEDAAEKLSRLFENFDHVWIQDEVPGSFLMQRLFPYCQKILRDRKLHFSSKLSGDELKGHVLHLQLKEDSFSSGRASLKIEGQTRSQIFMSPYKSDLLKERELQFYAEMALVFWMKELSDDFPIANNSPT